MRLVLLAFVVAGLLACGPLVMIPGGELSGEVKPVPADWSFSDEIETIQLETRPDSPYSVNIWGVGIGEEFYVAAGKAENAWARNIAVDDRVRLRVGGVVYEMRAVADDTQEGRERFLAAVKVKYDYDADLAETSDAILFRLIAR